MSMRTLVVGILALLAGTAAAVAANQVIRSWPATTVPSDPASVEIVVAKTVLHRGRTVGSGDLAMQQWPSELVPPDAIQDVRQAAGRVALTTHFANQPVLEPQLAARDVHSGLASIVPHGMRAFTIHIPTVATGVAGFVLPGNYVDVLLTLNANRVGGNPVTVTLLQRIEILAVDQELDVPTDNKVDAKRLQSVTLLVTPEQAAKLSLAESRGTLQLTLRNPDDESPAFVDAISLADLQFLSEEPLAVAPVAVAEEGTVEQPPRPRTKVLQIRTLRGTQSGFVTVRIPTAMEVNAADATAQVPSPPPP